MVPRPHSSPTPLEPPAGARSTTRGRWTAPHAGRPAPRSTTGSTVLAAVLGLLMVVALAKVALDSTSVAASPGVAVASAGNTDRCAAGGLVPVGDTGLCTHGQDAPMGDADLGAADASVSASSVGAGDPPISCVGAGTSGNRVEVLYARPSGTAARSGAATAIRAVATRANQIYRDSAAQTGGRRSIRFVHSDAAACVVTVTGVVLSPAAASSFAATITELRAKGFDETNRKYLVFMEADAMCGVGTTVPDDRRDPSNLNDVGPSYARVDRACWSPELAAHELMHTLGGVQDTAPNASLGGHCVDEYDVMCYEDAPYYPAMRLACPDPSGDSHLLDCNHDDYFHTAPARTSYLGTRWNAANNRFLIGAEAQPVLPAPANDDLDRALDTKDRSSLAARAVVSSATAAQDDPIASCAPTGQRATVWYKATPAAGTALAFDTAGSRYKTVVSVWTGRRGALTEVACDADLGKDGASRVRFIAKVRTTYYVMVGSAVAPGATELTLRLNDTAPVAPPAAVALSKDKSAYGGSVTATLTGFAPNASVTLRWPTPYESDGSTRTSLGRTSTDAAGRATIAFRTPLAPLGSYRLTARDAAGASAGATLRVVPRIVLGAAEGDAATKLRVSLSGFAPGDRVEVRWQADGSTTSAFKVVKTLTVAADGRASAVVAIPAKATAGTHLVVGTVVGVSRRVSTPFTLTSGAVAGGEVDDRTATPTPTATATATPKASPTPGSTETATPEPVASATPDPATGDAPATDGSATDEQPAVGTPEPATETETPAPTPAPNVAPVAVAGEDRTATDADGSGGEDVGLAAAGSADPEGGALTYAWTVDGAEVATGETATATLPVGTTTVTLTVTDGAGATATDEIVVTIDPAPAEESAPVDAAATEEPSA